MLPGKLLPLVLKNYLEGSVSFTVHPWSSDLCGANEPVLQDRKIPGEI